MVCGIAPAQTDLMLPDGKPLQVWEDETEYSRIYYVDKNHIMASDQNAGMKDMPFRTIGKAAAVLKPGQKVIIEAGTYRETVIPVQGGASAKKMICYEAAKGAKVIISGAEKLTARWERSIAPNGEPFSTKLWQIELPEDRFDASNPFQHQNASEEEINLMPWAVAWKNRVPYTLPRGMVFQNDRRMVQMATYEDLIKLQGTYWVSDDRKTLHIHPFEGRDPNHQNMEVTTRQQLFKPMEVGVSYIRIDGLQFEKAGNGFPRIGVGAVFVNGGDHWLIENSTVRQCNSVGLEIGARINEHSVATAEETQRVKKHMGGFIVRNNEIYDCGTGGIQGHNLLNTLVQNNHLHHIGWQDVERYWECAAIKLLVDVNTIVADNLIHHIEAACAVWLDWDIRNSRITRNIIHDIALNYNGAVFIEASKVPNLIDNNIFWDLNCIGVALYDTDHTAVVNNLFGETEIAVSSRVNTNRKLNSVPLTSKGNRIQNNIFYKVRQKSIMESRENTFDRNLFVSETKGWTLQNWNLESWDTNSHVAELALSFDKERLMLVLSTDVTLPKFQRSIKHDFFQNFREEETTAGPFSAFTKGKATYWLNR